MRENTSKIHFILLILFNFIQIISSSTNDVSVLKEADRTDQGLRCMLFLQFNFPFLELAKPL
jgi:hypothetical protein